ncbi:hypothetical protein FGADI_2351 [Fusarium gaditjirri]|uniref:Uncharacterized protein n=1 Tax=Fusarium gaditjirri TaxID=282569 RepID=A0A8H4X297_9HYPO|nr:hypothetical protein FGADI_2351 [Fusarium gaditjirri]
MPLPAREASDQAAKYNLLLAHFSSHIDTTSNASHATSKSTMELSRPAHAQLVAASRPRAGQDVSAAPVRELERTIAGFQAILTDQDRKKLQQLKTTSHDSQSIITFTAELDLLDKNRRGKSVASRLASFLQTIEQFTPVVDTYIQSNPDLSALIWGSVKLTFMFLANFASYFQSFVELLHGFGSLCARFAEYQVIFNESFRLRKSICEFHTAVVTCCQQIILAIRRPLKNQLLKAITQSFQSEIRKYVEDIRARAEEVQDDIQLVKAQRDHEEQQLQTTERQEATNHRKRLLAWTSKSTTEMEALQAQRRRNALEQKRRRLLKDLSSFNFTWAFNSTRNKRHAGTAKWVFDNPEFQGWAKTDGPQVLHITGKRNDAALNINILISSREACTNAIRGTFPGSQRLVTGLQKTSADIAEYVEDIIVEKLSTGELVVSDPSLVDEILKTIASKEQGMFLWAFLAIEDICSGKSDKEIRQALRDIPSDLPATFDRALKRIVERRNQHIAKKAFMWTKAVTQPLTLLQLREALSIEIGQHALRQEDLISGIERLPVWCENLLYVEETDNTVRFSHHSIQEFLLVPGLGEYGALHIDSGHSDKLVGEVCITYVNLDNFQTALAERNNGPLTPSAIKIDPSGIAEQTIQSAIQGGVGTRVGRLARHFVKTSNPEKSSTQRDFSLSSPLPVTSKAQGTTDYPFLEYASANWFKHTKYIDEKEAVIWRLFSQLVQKPPQHSQGEPWHSTEWKNEALAGFPNYAHSRNECYRDLTWITEKVVTRESDSGPTFFHLCLAFIYAEFHGYHGLACRSFQLLVKFPWMLNEFEDLVCVLAANKDYDACQNDCARLIPIRLNHRQLVAELRKAIAHGISSFPELPGYKSHPCDCADQPPREAKLDICQVLKTGYRRRAQPHLQAFAIVSEAFQMGHDMPGILDLSITCNVESSTLFEAKNIYRMFLIDVLIQGLLSSAKPFYGGTVSDSVGRFVEYETTPTFGFPFPLFNPQRLEPPSSMPEHRSIAYTICFLALLDAERPPASTIEESLLHEVRRSGKLMNLHGETIATIFRRLVIPELWPTHVASYIVRTLFGDSLKSDAQHIFHAHEDSFREAVWNNNWDVAAALLELQPSSLDSFTGPGQFTYIREALRCQNCWRCTQNVVRQLSSSEMGRYSFRLCEGHVSYFNKIAGSLGNIYYISKGTLLCPGHSTDALPEREGKLKSARDITEKANMDSERMPRLSSRSLKWGVDQ